MVRHIVLFRLKESLSQAEKRDIAVRFKTAIEALPEVIGFIGKIEVGLNINENEKFDIALYSEFKTLDEVKAYSAHPSHVAAAGILAGHVDERASVDF